MWECYLQKREASIDCLVLCLHYLEGLIMKEEEEWEEVEEIEARE